VFVLPGVGRLLVTATLGREVIVVQSLALVIMLFILILNFFVDIAYGFLDPRIRDKADAHG
jgi:peptide/nickel transport system permease protein